VFKNYITIALRHLMRNRLYSLINIVGLAVGLAGCILILLYVQDELSYGTNWEKSDRIAVLNSKFSYSEDRIDDFSGAAGPFKKALTEYFPEEIKRATRFYHRYPVLFIDGKVTDQQVMWTDKETADMFDFDVLAGDMARTFTDTRSLALSKTVALKLFGSEDIIGRVLTLEMGDQREDYKIGAVYKDLPHNAILDLPAIALFDQTSAFPGYSSNWWNIQAATYFELHDGVPLSLLNGRFEEFVNTTVPKGFFPDVEKTTGLLTQSAMALEDIRLYGRNGTVQTVILMSAIAALILIIASINFINLSTARASQRAREVALRKSLGASRSNLIIQFLGESILMATTALVIGLVLVELALPIFGNFVSKDLVLDYSNTSAVAAIIGLIIAVGIFGGLYPAYLLSGFRPAETLKSNQSSETHGSRTVRSTLVVIQFAISIALIIASALIYIQRSYALNLDPGFNQQNLLVIQYLFRGDTGENREVLKERVLGLPGVTSAAFSRSTPPSGAGNPATFEVLDQNKKVTLPWQEVENDYFSVYQIPLIEGRLFLPNYATSVSQRLAALPNGVAADANLLLNESAAALLGYSPAKEALGKTLTTQDIGRRPMTFTVVGIVGDTRFSSTRRQSPPQFYTASPTQSNLTLRFTGNSEDITAALETLWQDLYPEVPLYSYFVEDAMKKAFDGDAKASTSLTLFSSLAILIACLGLYGLAAFTAEQRTKEIGLRKVLGAGVLDITRLLVWQFSKPVLLANLIAWPVAIWAMLQWLEEFAYRVDGLILLPLCLGAGVTALLIAWLTVGGNAARVARENPIKSLRHE